MNPLQRFLLENELGLTQHRQLRLHKRILRDESNPFHLADKQSVELSRVNEELMQYSFLHLTPGMAGVRTTIISPQERILAVLRFFATGIYQRDIGKEHLLSQNQQNISWCIHEVAEVIVRVLLDILPIQRICAHIVLLLLYSKCQI